MSKRIYILVWKDKDGNANVDGYWNRELTEEEQHGYFKEHYPASYDPANGMRCDIVWEMVELTGTSKPVPLPPHQWVGREDEPWMS